MNGNFQGHIDRRATPRIETRVEARLSTPQGAPIDCLILDFSDGGLRAVVETDAAMEELAGQVVILELELSADDHRFPYSLAARVKRTDGQQLGLAYLKTQPALSDALRQQVPFIPDLVTGDEAQQPQIEEVELERVRRLFIHSARDELQRALGDISGPVEAQLLAAANGIDNPSQRTELLYYSRRAADDCGEIERQLLESLVRNTEALGSGEQAETDAAGDELSLPADDQDQGWPRLDDRRRCAEQSYLPILDRLTERLNSLFGTAFDRETNPISPHQICRLVYRSVSKLELPAAAREAYFVGLDKAVVCRLGDGYHRLELLLRDQGILLDPEPEEPYPDPAHQVAEEIETVPIVEELDHPLAREELEQLLRELAPTAPAGLAEGAGVYSSLLQRLGERLGDLSKHLDPADLQALELGETLFRSLHENPELPAAVKGWLLELEQLVTGTMLQNDGFIRDRNHPVRRFLSALTEAGSGGAALHQELIGLIPELGNRLREAADSVQGFEAASSMLDPLVRRKQDQEQENMARTLEQCEAEQLIERARTEVEATLEQRLGDTQLPRFALDLLHGGWRHLLTLIYLRRGTAHPEWEQAIELTDALGALFAEPPKTAGSRLAVLEDAERLIRSHQFLHLLNSPSFIKAKDAAYRLENEIELQLPAEDLEQISANRQENQAEDGETGPPEILFRDSERFAVGSWFRYRPEQDPEANLRLSWIGEGLNRYVFVNSLGVKVLDLRQREFATRLRDRSLTPIRGQDFTAVDESIGQVVERLYGQLAYQASHDELTGLVNRREFERRLQLALESARKEQSTHMLGFISLQQVDAIRKDCGYEAGNQAVKEIAELLGADLAATATLSRTGIDKFCILHEYCDEPAAFKIAGEQIERVERFRHRAPQGSPYSVNISIGLVPVDADSGNAPAVLNEAELACIAAERAGHNSVRLFSARDRLPTKAARGLEWHSRIRQNLDENRLALRAQRIQPLQSSGALPHYEILLSVPGDNGQLQPPGEFIQAAEDLGLMLEVDQWVVRTVFNWIAAHPGHMRAIKMLSINLSGQTMSNDRLLEYVFEQMAQNRVPQQKICFEITETAAIANLSDAADFIGEMQNLGCKFSLDDFGTGMASYSYLKQLPVNYLKIDGSLVKEIYRDRHDEAMVQSITQVAHVMGKQVVAEFAENQAIIAKLGALGVDYAQGWGVERPQPLDSLPIPPPMRDARHKAGAPNQPTAR